MCIDTEISWSKLKGIIHTPSNLHFYDHEAILQIEVF